MDLAFTVFTPTYNRAGTLPAVYASLKAQTFRSFEWILVDDGSTDDTPQVIRGFLEDADFPIRHLTQKNSGKHVAQNRAVEQAAGELFLPLDSDDTMTSDALEILWDQWQEIQNRPDREKFSGIGVHCQDQNGNRVGDPWPESPMISNDLEMHFRYRIQGEKWGPIATSVMRQYRNEEVTGHFLTESTMWYRIAKQYQKVYIDRCLRIYEVHEDSVSRQARTKGDDRNFESFRLATCVFINEFWPWYAKYEPKMALRLPLALAKRSAENHRPILLGRDSVLAAVKPLPAKLLVLLASPYGLVCRLRK